MAVSSFRTILRRSALPALALIVMAFFGGYAVLGPNGALAYGNYKRELAQRKVEYAALDHKRSAIKNRVERLDPDHADPDMVDQMVRLKMKVVDPDDVIVPTP